MESQRQPKSIRWAPRLQMPAVDAHRSGVNTARLTTISNPGSSRMRRETNGRDGDVGYTASVSPSVGQDHTNNPVEEAEGAVERCSNDTAKEGSLSEYTPSIRSTAPSTGTASTPHTNAGSTSPPTSTFEDQDLEGDSWTIDIRQTGRNSAIEVIEICQGTFVAIKEGPSDEDKLQWRALRRRIHMAIAKTCKRYPNLSLQFKLVGASAHSLQPMILFVCPDETQKRVRKFVKKQKWLSQAECGYENMILEGNFLRVALDGEGGVDGGLFIHTDMSDVQTLCGKLGRLEGTLGPSGIGSRFTIGGVVVVNDTLCCLTAGHVLFDGPITSEVATSDEEDETDEEEEPRSPVTTGHPPAQSQISSDHLGGKSHEADVARDQYSEETRIGRLLTTSNWKRGILASNEDWSLIQLDAVSSTDKWIVNQFNYPGTEASDSLKVTIDKLALSEADITGAEVIILAGYSGPQKAQLNTTAVQLYLDNATFEAREIATHEPLKMGDSGSWVVQGSKLLGHVFAVQDGTPWSYMIPISQVIDDIQNSLLSSSIELPISTNRAEASLLCPRARRTHASLAAFGVLTCPSCDQDLVHPAGPRDQEPKVAYEDFQVPTGDDKGLDSYSTESYESSEFSDHSIRMSTVPPSYLAPSTVPTSYLAPSTVDPRYFAVSGASRYERGSDRHVVQYIPFSGNFVYRDEYSPPDDTPLKRRGKVPFVELKAVLDEVQPRNVSLERLIEKDANILLDLSNPVNDNVRTTELTLVTPSLNTAFRHVIPWDPLINQRDRQIVLNEPYAVLLHHLPRLTAYASELRGAKSDEKAKLEGSGSGEHSTSAGPQLPPQPVEIEALVAFTQRFIDATELETEFSRHGRNACTFTNLWLLFYPGLTVYARDSDSRGLAAFIVSAVETDPSVLRIAYGRGRPYRIHMWRLHYDGRYVDRERCSVGIPCFYGERDIITLKVFPCKYLDQADDGKTRRRLEEQGRRWYQLLRGRGAYYSGKLPTAPDEHYEGHVVVDRDGNRDSLSRLHDEILLPFNDEPDHVRANRKRLEHNEAIEAQDLSFPWACYSRLDPETIQDLELPGEPAEGKRHRYLLCAPYLPGFLLKDKRWSWLDIRYCSQGEINPSALDQLWLPAHAKEIIRILAQDLSQTIASTAQDSQRQKQSRNLTILLQGSSGTGKTYTAECLAEAQGKVLMTIHPGDIGSDPFKAKEVLPLWLRLAQIFDAIVLVPSADPYLEQVSTVDAGRSDIFSFESMVFWACLESYRGVVILTKSRLGVLSDVALSRINLPLYYPPLGVEGRLHIGKQLMRRLGENESFKLGKDAQAVWETTLREGKWNGHEIRSSLENALAMARTRHRIDHNQSPGLHESPILTSEDIKAAVQSRRDFEEYLEVSHSHVIRRSREQQGPSELWPSKSPG